MASAKELLATGTTMLSQHVCAKDSAAQEALELLAFASGVSREILVRDSYMMIEDLAAMQYMSLVEQRIGHMPLAYLLGTAPFMGHEFKVTRDTLIPRDATEVLVRAVIARADHPGLIVDAGTGSGCVAVSLALEFPEASVVGYDISEKALECAKENTAALGAGNARFVLASRFTDAVAVEAGRADIIVANLPYIPTAQIATLMPDVCQFEPFSALDGGADGLDLYRVLLQDLVGYDWKMVAMEIFPEQFEAVQLHAQELFSDVTCSSVINDGNVVIGIILTKNIDK